MKKNLFTALLFLLAASFAGTDAGASVAPPVMKIRLEKAFTHLVVEDHIRIMLTNESGNEIAIHGDIRHTRHLRASLRKNKLYLWLANGEKGEQVVVYVPGRLLRQITLNGDSHVSTKGTLQNKQLSVWVNGACTLNLRSAGKVDVNGTSEFEYRIFRD